MTRAAGLHERLGHARHQARRPILSDKQVKLGKACRFSSKLPGGAKRPFTVSARFGGNTVLLPISKSRRFK